MAEVIGAIVAAVGPLLAALIGAVGGIKFVSEGERAVLLRFEKVVRRDGRPKVVHPGFTWIIPKLHRLARIHVRQRTINFPPQTIVLSDRTIFEVSAVLICEVEDTPEGIYRALFETSDLNLALTDYGLTVIRDVLTGKKYTDVIGEEWREIAGQLQEAMRVKATEWGVLLLSFSLTDCRPAEGTAQLLLTGPQADFRREALEKLAEKLGVGVTSIDPGMAAVFVGQTVVAGGSSPYYLKE